MQQTVPNVEELFFAALELENPEARSAFLDGVCGDTDLRRRVERLLTLDPEANGYLEAPASMSTVTAAPGSRPDDEVPGTSIGPYRLLEAIGEGGMGAVYMAEQTDPVRRRVALKVIKPGMDSRQVVARFEAERQALALMDHVNIARVFDAGATRAGRPYFVMELVHGMPITKYCNDNRLTPRQRLALFVPVCQAIHHAHQKGIIHRDVKPSNVLVTHYDGMPVPKVIDFGVAKATEKKLTERTLFTQDGTLVGTLEYMSPEQAEMSALGVDTRSDIYSLGVLLYELLTGSTPLSGKRMKDAAYAEILRMIREEEPPKPSTRLGDSGEALASISAQRHMEPAKLSKLVRGELDWIVMKSLEKDRNRRYDTALGLAADLQRYLNNEAVQASSPSSLYRFRKFAGRNKRFLATGGLVALALIVGIVASTWQAIRATDAEARAGTNYEVAESQRQKVQNQLVLTEQAQNQAIRGLYESRLAQAKAGSLSRRPGQRFGSLAALSKAAELARGLKLPASHQLQLRNAAIACLALPDMRIAKEWDGWPPGSSYIDFDGNLKHYAISDVRGAVRVYRVADHAQIADLPATGTASWTMFSRDGKFICVHSGTELRVWSLADSKPSSVIKLAAESIVGLDFSPDSRSFVISQSDGSISVYNLGSGRPVRRSLGGTPGLQLVVGPGNRFAISCNTAVEIRDLVSGEVTATLDHPAQVNNLGWHPDGKMMAVACSNLRVYLWDTTTKRQVFALEGFRNDGNTVTFNHTGNLLATTGWEGKTRLWDTRTGRQLFSAMGTGGMTPRFSADDRYLSVSIRDGKLGLWEIAECNEYRTLVHASAESNNSFFNASVCGDGRLLAVGMMGGVGLWELSSGRQLGLLNLPGTNFTTSEASGALLTNNSAGLSRWEVRRESSSDRFRVGPARKLSLPGSMFDIACDRNGRVIASAQSSGGLVLHADRPDQPVPLVPHHDVRYVSVSIDGKLVATGSHGVPTVKIWDSDTGKLLKVLPGVAWGVNFSPDGKWLGTVAGGYRLWKVGTWEEGPKIGGGEGAAFSPDSKLLAVESGDGSIRLVDPNTGVEHARLEDPDQDRARHITFSPDGTTLIATNDDSRSIHVWNLRLIRRGLAALGLDWDLPAYLPVKTDTSQPLSIEVDATASVKASVVPTGSLRIRALHNVTVDRSKKLDSDK